MNLDFMLLQTNSLRFAHSGQAPISFPDISLAGGEALLILGQSGSGKTTLLNLLAGLLTPSQGSVVLDGVNLSTLKGHRLDLFRGQHIGIVFQKPHLIAALSVKQNLELAQFFGKKKGLAPVDLLRNWAWLPKPQLQLVHSARERPSGYPSHAPWSIHPN